MKIRLRRILRAAIAALILLSLVIGVEIAAGWHCNLQGQINSPVAQTLERHHAIAKIPNYLRPEDDTFLSYPEWYIVWSYQEKADFQKHHLPSGFPYFGAVRQYWSGYCCISRVIRGKYPVNFGEQLMLVVIGTSFSAEYILKGAYEKTLGKLSEWSSGGQATQEDEFAYKVAREYADFVHVRPFYEFHFARHVSGLWKSTPLFGEHFIRKWERKGFLTMDYAAEAFYCWIIEKLTHLTYGVEPSETYAWVDNASSDEFSNLPHARILKQVGPRAFIASIPRYQEFTTVALALAKRDVQFEEIAGNSQVLLSVTAPTDWRGNAGNATLLFSQPILTNGASSRFVLNCPVGAVSESLKNLDARGITVEHVYDY